ncbi:hypothetical protein mRhiFer1_009955 [Rhinolophus ferrumequinum]|uniref:Uncharacterized protein n=1 Tax=Rhinolophus ferrumequinum TaxID=59479 RepID=A0A7J7YIQ2_RHIFE|nr:hypothetical protein mRhiFer1_009955 [Rhinolophus ferrumequinum]
MVLEGCLRLETTTTFERKISERSTEPPARGTDHKCRERLLELYSESLNDRDRMKRLSCKPGMDGSRSTSEDKGFNVDAKEKATKPAIGKKKVKMSALGLGEDDAKSPGDSESFSARRPQKYVDHFSDTADRR